MARVKATPRQRADARSPQNVVLVIANGTGTTNVVEGWTAATDRVRSGGDLSEFEIADLGRYLYKLQLEPQWTDQLNRLDELWSQSNPPREYRNPCTRAWGRSDSRACADSCLVEDPEILNAQYIGQIVVTSFQLYGIKVPDESYTTLQQLYTINTTMTPDPTERRTKAYQDVAQIIAEPFTLSLTGTLWLYPTAVSPVFWFSQPACLASKSDID